MDGARILVCLSTVISVYSIRIGKDGMLEVPSITLDYCVGPRGCAFCCSNCPMEQDPLMIWMTRTPLAFGKALNNCMYLQALSWEGYISPVSEFVD